jgi:sensor histidine kinase YesM
MLENYLALEQLRFKNKFAYEIHVSPDLNTDEISIPPILIQPFVENAIVHGMKNKDTAGKIEIGFEQNANILVVTITDNGPGIADPKTPVTEPGHKSVGMTLTQRRLDILSGQANDEILSHENIIGEDGGIIGSRVTVGIPVE